MSTFYRTGPEDKWPGIVELFDDGVSYIHHSTWPERRTYVSTLSNPVSYYVNSGHWAHAYELESPEVDACL
jgi:hypothetical protein